VQAAEADVQTDKQIMVAEELDNYYAELLTYLLFQ
jgi:hypothetical protein